MKLWLAQLAIRAGLHRLILRLVVLQLFLVLLVAVSLCGTLSAGMQSSTIAWPVPIPAAGKEADGWRAGGWEVSSRFGWRDNPLDPGNLEFHDGIDLAGKPFDLKQPTVSVFDGQVAYVGWDQPHAERPDEVGGGQVVVVKNGNGEMEALYAHLQPYKLYIQLQGRQTHANQYFPIGTAGLQPEPLDASIDMSCIGDGATFVPTRLSPGTYLLLYDRAAACTTTVTWPAESGWYADGPTSLTWQTPVEEAMLAEDIALRFRGRLIGGAITEREESASQVVAQPEPRAAALAGHPGTGSVVPRRADAPPRGPSTPGTRCERSGTQTRCRWSLGDVPDRTEQFQPAPPRAELPATPAVTDTAELDTLYPGVLVNLPRSGDGRPAGDVVVQPTEGQAVEASPSPGPRRPRPAPQYGPRLQPIRYQPASGVQQSVSLQQGVNMVVQAQARAIMRQAEQGEIDTSAPCYRAAKAALTKQGARYSQGGHLAGDPIDPSTGTFYPRTGPNSFDCSGLTWWAYQQAGITLGGVVSTQALDGVRIPCSLADLRGPATTCWAPGDLIMLAIPGIGPSHVAIYVGSGLFMDCYNHAVNCVLHEVQHDWAYRTYFWQARRYANGCSDHVLEIPPPSAGWSGGGGMVRQPQFKPGGPCVDGIPAFQKDIETFPGCGPPLDLGTRLKMLDSRVGYIGQSGAATGPHLHFGLTQVGLGGQPPTTQVCTDAWLQGRRPPPGAACTTRQVDPLDFLPRAHATKPLTGAQDAPAVDEPYQLPPPGTAGALFSSPAPEASPAGEYWSPNTDTGRFGGGSIWDWLRCWLVPLGAGCS